MEHGRMKDPDTASEGIHEIDVMLERIRIGGAADASRAGLAPQCSGQGRARYFCFRDSARMKRPRSAISSGLSLPAKRGILFLAPYRRSSPASPMTSIR